MASSLSFDSFRLISHETVSPSMVITDEVDLQLDRFVDQCTTVSEQATISTLDWNNIPVSALSAGTIELLSDFLDIDRLTLFSQSGLLKDWRGLAELMGLNISECSRFEQKGDKTRKLLRWWIREEGGKIGELMEMLLKIERGDVLDRIRPLVDNDIFHYTHDSQVEKNPAADFAIDHPIEESRVLPKNINDIKSEEEKFDLYILYHEDDEEWAYVIDHVLRNDFGYKCCLFDRDVAASFTAANFEPLKICDYIRRCNYVLIILSQSLLHNDQFHVNFSLCSSIRDQESRNFTTQIVLASIAPGVKQELRSRNSPMGYYSIIDLHPNGKNDWSQYRLVKAFDKPVYGQIETWQAAKQAGKLAPPALQAPPGSLPLMWNQPLCIKEKGEAAKPEIETKATAVASSEVQPISDINPCDTLCEDGNVKKVSEFSSEQLSGKEQVRLKRKMKLLERIRNFFARRKRRAVSQSP